MALSAIRGDAHSAIAMYDKCAPSSRVTSVAETVGDIFTGVINVAMWASAFFHLYAPKYSPILWWRGFTASDDPQFAENPELAAKIEKIKNRIEGFRVKMGLSSPITLMVKEGHSMIPAQALGGLPGLSSPVIALVADKIEDLPQEELDAVICHELAHIKNHDNLKFGAYLITATMISVLVAPLFASLTGAAYALYAASDLALMLGGLSLLSRSVEKAADLDAAATLGSAKGLIAPFEKIMKNHMELREDSWFDALLISPKGDVRWDIFHPTFEERIQYLKEFQKNRRLVPSEV